MVVVKAIKHMYTFTSLKLVVDEITTPYLVLVTFTGVTSTYEIARPRVAYSSQYLRPKV